MRQESADELMMRKEIYQSNKQQWITQPSLIRNRTMSVTDHRHEMNIELCCTANKIFSTDLC